MGSKNIKVPSRKKVPGMTCKLSANPVGQPASNFLPAAVHLMCIVSFRIQLLLLALLLLLLLLVCILKYCCLASIISLLLLA